MASASVDGPTPSLRRAIDAAKQKAVGDEKWREEQESAEGGVNDGDECKSTGTVPGRDILPIG